MSFTDSLSAMCSMWNNFNKLLCSPSNSIPFDDPLNNSLPYNHGNSSFLTLILWQNLLISMSNGHSDSNGDAVL